MTAPLAQGAKPARRSLLNLLLGVGVIGWAASVLYPVLRYLRPLSEAGAGSPLKLSAEELAILNQRREGLFEDVIALAIDHLAQLRRARDELGGTGEPAEAEAGGEDFRQRSDADDLAAVVGGSEG